MDLDIQEFLLMNDVIKIAHYVSERNVYWDRSIENAGKENLIIDEGGTWFNRM